MYIENLWCECFFPLLFTRTSQSYSVEMELFSLQESAHGMDYYYVQSNMEINTPEEVQLLQTDRQSCSTFISICGGVLYPTPSSVFLTLSRLPRAFPCPIPPTTPIMLNVEEFFNRLRLLSFTSYIFQKFFTAIHHAPESNDSDHAKCGGVLFRLRLSIFAFFRWWQLFTRGKRWKNERRITP